MMSQLTNEVRPAWRRAATLLGAAVSLVSLTAACCIPMGDLDSEASAAAPSPADEPPARTPLPPEIDGILNQLYENTRVLQGPDAGFIADQALGTNPTDDPLLAQRVAVRVVPGSPRRVVVLLLWAGELASGTFYDTSAESRRMQFDLALESIDQRYGAGDDDIALAIGDPSGWGIIGRRPPGGSVEMLYELAELEPLLAATPGADDALAAEPLPYDQAVHGTLRAPHRPPRYVFELTRAGLVTLSARATQERQQLGLRVCSSPVPIGACEDHVLHRVNGAGAPLRLAAGTHYVMVSGTPCSTTGALGVGDCVETEYELRLRRGAH